MKLIAILLLSSLSFAATRTASVTGDWSNTATWGGSAAPTSADDVLINNGVAVTCSGTCAAKTLACTTSGGTCVFNGSSGSFTYHGNVAMGASDWTFSAGFSIIHDDDGVTSNHFTWAQNYAGKLILNGSSGSHITWGIAPGSGYAGTIGNALGSAANGQQHGTYVDFSDIAAVANGTAFQANLNGSGAEFTCDHCTYNRVGSFLIDNWAGDANFAVTNFSYQNGYSGPHGVWWFYHMGAKTGGTRALTGGYWDAGALTMYADTNSRDVGMVVQDNFCYITDPSLKCVDPGNPTPAFSADNWKNNVFYRYDGSNASTQVVVGYYGGNTTRTYILTGTYLQPTCASNYGLVNYHLSSDVPNIPTTLDGIILEQDCSDLSASSDQIQNDSGSVSAAMEIKNSINLPAPPFGAAGAFTTYIGGSGTPRPVTGHNNTINAAGVNSLTGSCGYGFDSSGVSGIYGALTDNIFWQPSSSYGCGAEGTATSPADAYSSADHNAFFNITGPHYRNSGSIFVTPPGTGDQTGDPQFVDSTRNFLKWCQSLDNTITDWAGCRAKFISHTAGFTPSALIDYVRAGFAPQAAFIATMSTTGSYVGAVAPAASSSTMTISGATIKGASVK